MIPTSSSPSIDISSEDCSSFDILENSIYSFTILHNLRNRHLDWFSAIIEIDSIQIVKTSNSIDKQHPFEMVDLVVYYHRIETLKDLVEAMASFILSSNPEKMRAYRLSK
jgi:hypothetical protein